MTKSVRWRPARLAAACVLTLLGTGGLLAQQDSARYLGLVCDADQSAWPSVPEGVYRPRSVTLRFDTIGKSVRMEESGSALASSPAVMFSERARCGLGFTSLGSRSQSDQLAGFGHRPSRTSALDRHRDRRSMTSGSALTAPRRTIQAGMRPPGRTAI